MESYILIYILQTNQPIKVHAKGDVGNPFWLAKSQIAIDEVEIQEYDGLQPNEELDIYIPDWLAESAGLL